MSEYKPGDVVGVRAVVTHDGGWTTLLGETRMVPWPDAERIRALEDRNAKLEALVAEIRRRGGREPWIPIWLCDAMDALDAEGGTEQP